MFYLASTSPRRKRLLRGLGLRFLVRAPSYKEESTAGPPSKVVQTHALGKALSVARRVQNGTVLGADTIVYFQRKVVGKPKDRKDAFRILSALQGRGHTVYTGVALVRVLSGRIAGQTVFSERTRVYLKKMDTAAIRAYFKEINPLDKAGAYAIQSRKTGLPAGQAGIVRRVRGSFSNAVGLPVEKLYAKLKS